MLKEEYLADEQFEDKYLMSLKKEELVSRLQALNDTRKELAENNAELRTAHHQLFEASKELSAELAATKKQCKTLWRIIEKCFDVKDLLDDLEDTAEELNEAAQFLLDKDKEEDD